MLKWIFQIGYWCNHAKEQYTNRRMMESMRTVSRHEINHWAGNDNTVSLITKWQRKKKKVDREKSNLDLIMHHEGPSRVDGYSCFLWKNLCYSLTDITSSGAPFTIWYNFRIKPEGTPVASFVDSFTSEGAIVALSCCDMVVALVE